MQRVFLGRFGAIAHLGLRVFLEEQGFEVVDPIAGSAELLSQLAVGRPDVVVLDLDSSDTPELARCIIEKYPSMTVIACSAERPSMRVYPCFCRGESYESHLSSILLAEAVRG